MSGNTLTLGSLFSGSGGFELAGILAGIKPVWKSEIEPFPLRVTSKRMPDVKNLGDINAIDGGNIEPVDIITFGSPCQDMSVAGKRGGLDGSRSVLFYEAVRIIKEMRCRTDGKYPGYIVFENVTGAFSSNGGEDFRCVLESICRVKDEKYTVPGSEKWQSAGEILGDGFSLAWRVLDAQYWGVPQRRKRIYLVADFTGERAGKILFEPESVSWHTPQGFRTREGTAGSAEDSSGETGCAGIDGYNASVSDKASTPGVNCGMSAGRNGVMVINDDQAFFKQKVFGISAKDSGSMKPDNPKNGFYEAKTSRSPDGSGGNPKCSQGGMAVVDVKGNGSRPSHHGSGYSEDGVSFTLNTIAQHGVAYSMTTGSYMQFNKEKTATLAARDYKDPPVVNGKPCGFYPQMKAESVCLSEEKSGCLVNGTNPGRQNGVIDNGYIVRRLTPTECARLQGFPDWWCSDLGTENPDEREMSEWREIFETYRKAAGSSAKPKTENQIRTFLKNPHSDSAEYRMWGNGIALPCAYFVLAGIARAHNL